jgi:hypothetical protein
MTLTHATGGLEEVFDFASSMLSFITLHVDARLVAGPYYLLILSSHKAHGVVIY